MINKNKIFFVGLLALGAGLIYFLLKTQKYHTANQVSFTPIFKIAGVAPQTIDRAISKVIMINDIDEKDLGEAIRESYSQIKDDEINMAQQLYLNKLISQLSQSSKKHFEYSVHLVNSEIPNAMAFPGGVILVTSNLMGKVKSEGELIAVLAHEMGHIELSHCLDSVKYEILAKKISFSDLGKIADFANNLLIHHSFSKNQEDEADEYAYKYLVSSKYDPRSVSKVFTNLKNKEYQTTTENVNIFMDYLQSHPSLDSRISKFSRLAEQWWYQNPEARRYIGKANLDQNKTMIEVSFPYEYTGP